MSKKKQECEKMKEVLVTIPVQEEHRGYLEAIGADMHFTYVNRKEAATREMVRNADYILGNVKTEYLPQAQNLKFLQLDSAGANEYVRPGVLPEGVKLCNATGAYGVTIAEYLISVVFALKKKLPMYEENRKKHSWHDEGIVTNITGSKTLVLGLGDIGGTFARKMSALGSKVIGVRRNPAEKPEYLEGLYQMDALEELISDADIVVCTLPETAETYHLLDERKLRLMKPSAVLVNIGRGSLIPTKDLVRVLKEGVIAGAAIDVAEQEPLPEDSPLWETPNLIITPHVSGNYHTQDILDKAVKIAGENFRAFLEGKPLRNEVDFVTGYRKRVC